MTDTRAAEFNWKKLIDRICNRKVIPVIGEGLYTVLLPGGKETLLYPYLAKELAREAGYDLQLDSDHLFAKAAFAFLKKSGDAFALQTFLMDRIKKVSLSPSSRLHKLASIRPFQLIINTTYDDFLSDVLREVRNYPVKSFDYSRRQKSVLNDLNGALVQASQSPLSMVLNIYGNLEKKPDESAYCEADILETIVAFQEDLSRGQQQAQRIYEELSRKALLFIGCGYDDWLFRFFIRTFSTKAFGENVQPHFFGDNLTAANIREPQEELQQFLKHFDAEIYYSRDGGAFIDKLVEELIKKCPDKIISEEEYPAKVFISFHGADRKVAKRLAEALRKDGIKAWVDTREFQPGDPVDAKIINAITRCPVFMSLLSESSKTLVTDKGWKYHYQEWEWVRMFNQQKGIKPRIIMPVSIDGTSIRDEAFEGVSHLFKEVFYVHVPNGSGGDYDKLRDKLRTIGTLPGRE